MAVTATWYGLALGKEVKTLWTTNAPKLMLCTSQYTPNKDTHEFKSSVTGEVAIVSTTLSASASAGATTISTAASIAVGNAIQIGGAGGDVRVVTNVSGAGPFTLTVAALSAAAASGAAVVSGTGYTAGGITLGSRTSTYNAAADRLELDAADISIATALINARYGVVYDSTPASDATRPLFGYIDFGADQLASNGPFNITWDALGVLNLTAV